MHVKCMDFHFSPFLHTLILSGDDLYEHVFQLSFAMLPLLLHALSTQRISICQPAPEGRLAPPAHRESKASPVRKAHKV